MMGKSFGKTFTLTHNQPIESTVKTVSRTSPNVILILVSLVQFSVPFLLSAVGIALPVIGSDLDASSVQLSLIQTAQVLALSVFLLPVGRFADIHGRKRIFISGTSLLFIATLIQGFAQNIELFISLRFVQGIGASMIISTSIAILTSVFPHGRRGRAMGIVVGMLYLGVAAGPSVSGFIIEYLGWRWVFFFLSALILLSLVLSVAKLKGEWISARGEPFDWTGSAVFMLSVLFLVYGATELLQQYVARWVFLAGLAGLALFLGLERRTVHPILDVRLLTKNPAFTFSNLVTFIHYAAIYSFIFFLSLYLQYIKGVPPRYAGLLLIIQPLVQSILAPVAGRLADSYPPSRIATTGMAFCTAGLFIAGTLDAATPFALIVFVTVLQGISLGLFSTPNLTFIMGCAGERHAGTASSMVATMRYAGTLASTTLIAIVFSVYMGDRQVTSANREAFLESQRVCFHLFGAMSLAGTLFSMIQGKLVRSISRQNG